MRYLLVFLFGVVTLSLSGQQIKILDIKTNEPVSGVVIYTLNKDKTSTTNLDGVANLNDFKSDALLFFKHISYRLEKRLKNKLKSVILLHEDTQGLGEVVISASKFKQFKRDIPQKIRSLSSENIKFSNPQTSADLLATSGPVFVQKSQLGGGSPIIRGFSTNRVSLFVDGVRFNNAIFRSGNVQNVISIDPFNIKSTDVTLGPGSVIYGSDAIGGVVNFYTLKPKLSQSNSFKIQGNFALRYASASNENTGHFDVNFGLKKWAFLTSVSYTDFDDLVAGKNGPNDFLRPDFVRIIDGVDTVVENDNPKNQVGSGFNQINLSQKAYFKASERLSFDFGLQYSSTSNYNRYDRLTRRNNDGTLRSAQWFFGPQQWVMANAQLTKLSSSSNLYDKIKATLAYQNSKESRNDRNFGASNLRTRHEQVDALSFNIDFEKSITKPSKLFYGAEYVYNLVGSKAFQTDIFTKLTQSISSRYPNGSTWQSLAAYVSYKFKPSETLTFQSGLRYNQILINAKLAGNNAFFDSFFKNEQTNNSAITGSAGISWSPNKIMHWKLNASTAFRAPNIDDIGKVFDSEPGSVVVPNANLKPEYAYNGELGVAINCSDIVILDMGVYATFLDNALIRRPFELNGNSQVVFDDELSDVLAIQNASQAYIYGLEVGLKINVTPHLKLVSQYNIVRGEEEDADGVNVPVRHVVPDFGNTHLIWHKNKLKLDAFADYSAQLAFNQISPSIVSSNFLFATDANGNPFSPSWYTLNLRSQYQINERISVTATAENITNQLYRTYSSGISAPGLNIIAALRYKF